MNDAIKVAVFISNFCGSLIKDKFVMLYYIISKKKLFSFNFTWNSVFVYKNNIGYIDIDYIFKKQIDKKWLFSL